MPIQEKKDIFIQEMFSQIAGHYDLLNRLLSMRRDIYWRRFSVRELLKSGGDSFAPLTTGIFLDVATGTGDCAMEIIQIGGKGNEVIGVDFNIEMLNVSRNKIEREGFSDHIRLLQTNVFGLPFDDNYFDGVISAFGVRNFSDIRKGIREMRRVVKENGRFVILEFTNPSNKIFKRVYHLYFKKVLPFIGGIISGRRYAYEYLHDSVMGFPDQKELKKIMEEEGLRDVHYFNLTFGIVAVHVGKK
ncbi:MAG: bifunctional demethylmenaquinone methyltransferase/2-methoxy-6-polyprenyl-1,4-benzoquinol methylase UbiE [Nitrospinae bacterium]|nr:bifunctional demethylmenaquinone methyltransferase/2-methoxy-6-polyprenyl-1,4-benzoquinol methylase UbiE [Nitrospinota bacterium]